MSRDTLFASATPEMMSLKEGIPAFFGWAEKTHPEGVQELVGVIGSLMPEGGEAATEQGVREGLIDSNLDMGFNVLSSWLVEAGADGFRNINWPMRKTFLAAAAVKGIRLPAKEEVSGREVQAVLKYFSATMKKAEAKKMNPIHIVGGLLQESVGSKLTNNGSATLRTELARALGGEQNLKWLRGPLGIKDVVEAKPVAAQKPLPAAAMVREGEAKVEVDLTPNEKVFMETLEGLVGMEKSTGAFEARGLQQFEAKELQQYFQDMRSFFSRLPSGGKLRAEVMKNVNGQLGVEGEKLRKAGKKDGEIFDEWLKRVFIPLYRRANKNP